MLNDLRSSLKKKSFLLLKVFFTSIVLVLFSITVMAGSVTVNGTVVDGDHDISSLYYLWVCEFRYNYPIPIPSHQYTFTVSTTGTYLFMASNNDWGTAYVAIFQDNYSEENCLASGQDGTVVDLVAGQSYVMSVWVSSPNPETGENLGGRYRIEISGPGEININTGTDESGDFVIPPDTRINWQYGDSNVVIYEHLDGVVVYCYNGNAWLGMVINQELVDNWDTDLPQETPVLEVNDNGCHAAFYILDTGEYQINIWSYEGKLYEIIADNLNFRDATMRYHDPNE